MIANFGLKEKDILEITVILSKEPNVEKALIFGSRAKGVFKPGSDVDIALMGSSLTFSDISRISFQLNEETNMPWKFDVLNFNTIQEPALVEHIKRVGMVFYEKKKNEK